MEYETKEKYRQASDIMECSIICSIDEDNDK